jgi:hypothetical protein
VLKFVPPDALFCIACWGSKKAPPPGAPLCSAQRGANNKHTEVCIKEDQTSIINSQIKCTIQIQQIIHNKYNKYIKLFTPNTTSLRINIQHSLETIHHIVFKQIQQVCNYCCPCQFHHSSMISFWSSSCVSLEQMT